jgi:hypothetical protein
MRIQSAILNRMIMVALAALIGAGVSTRSGAVAMSVAGNCNPVSYLESVWQDLLGRDITPAEKTPLLDFLDRGGSNAQVAQIVLNRAEYRTKLVQSLYQQFLGRAAAQPEIDFLLSVLQQGATAEQLIAVIVCSNEYYQNRGGGTNNVFLGQLYNDILGRPIDANALAFGADLLNRGGSRLQIAQFILGSSEYRSIQIQSFFKTFLGRQASDSELNTFLALWQQVARREQIIAQIIGSAEYCESARRPSRGHHR